MTFGAVLHKELLWDFSFSVLGHGILTSFWVLFSLSLIDPVALK